MTHPEKVAAALEAINAVFGDTSVSKYQTLESMAELTHAIEMNVAAVNEDIAMEEGD